MSLLDPAILLDLSRQTGKVLGRKMSDVENIQMINKMREIPLGTYKHYPIGEITKQLSKYVARELDQSRSAPTTDIHQWLKEAINQNYVVNFTTADKSFADQVLAARVAEATGVDEDLEETLHDQKEVEFKSNTDNTEEAQRLATFARKGIDVNSFFNVGDLHYIQRVLNPKSQYKHVYVLLDTENASEVLSAGTRFTWNFMPDANLAAGTVNAIGAAHDLVGMRIFPIKTDLISTPSHTFVESTVGIGLAGFPASPIYRNDFTNLNNNFTILVEEFQAQAFVGRDGRKFHFVLFPFLLNPLSKNLYGSWTPNNPYYEFQTSGKGNGQFWFKTPITGFSTITISMANPFVTFPLSKTTRTLIPLELIFLNEATGDT